MPFLHHRSRCICQTDSISAHCMQYLISSLIAPLIYSCKKFDPVSTCSCPKYINYCFWNLGNGREDETDFDKLLSVLIIKKNFWYILLKLNFSYFWKQNYLYTSIFIFSTIFQILITKLFVLRSRTRRNLTSIKFPKHHMPWII